MLFFRHLIGTGQVAGGTGEQQQGAGLDQGFHFHNIFCV
jgi:hypothetical protein